MTNRSAIVVGILAAVATLACGPAARSEEPQAIRIGYAISLTGPNAAGAATTVLPNYRLWRHEVNAAGGIMLASVGKRVPIEFVEYDDHSSVDDALAAVERLIDVDKVDFILPPWGTGLNLAVAPLFYRGGYPLLGGHGAQRRSAGIGQTLAQHVLVPRHHDRGGDGAGRNPLGSACRGQDRRQCRHGERRRSVRHRSRQGRAPRFQKGKIRHRLRSALSGRSSQHAGPHRRGQSDPSGHVRGFQLSAGYDGDHRTGERVGVQPQGLLYRRRHRLPGFQATLRRGRRRRHGDRRLGRGIRREQTIHGSATWR